MGVHHVGLFVVANGFACQRIADVVFAHQMLSNFRSIESRRNSIDLLQQVVVCQAWVEHVVIMHALQQQSTHLLIKAT